MKVSTAVVGTVFFAAAGMCYAQLGGAPMPQVTKRSGPTLDETAKWITEKFETTPPAYFVATTGERHEYKNRAVFDGCSFGYAEQASHPNRGGPNASPLREYKVVSVDLKELSEEDIKTFQEPSPHMVRVTITTPNRREILNNMTMSVSTINLNNPALDMLIEKNRRLPPVVRNERSRIGDYDVVRSSTWVSIMYFPDMEIAERIRNAFTHAVTLCRQKALEEKAAQPPRPKEIF